MGKPSFFDRIFRKDKIAKEEALKPKLGDVYYEEHHCGGGGSELRMSCVRTIRYKIVDIQDDEVTLVNIQTGEYKKCTKDSLRWYRKEFPMDAISREEIAKMLAKKYKL